MSLLIARLGELLAQGAQFPDTIVTKQVPVSPGWFATIVGIAQIITTLTIFILIATLIPVAIAINRNRKRIDQLLDTVQGDLGPLIRTAHTAAEKVTEAAASVNHIASKAKDTVDQVSGTVQMANDRLAHAILGAETRVRELNALVGLVQREAEGVFVVTASALRGIRAGAHSLRGRALREMVRRAAAQEDSRDDAGADDGDDAAPSGAPLRSSPTEPAVHAEHPRVRRRR